MEAPSPYASAERAQCYFRTNIAVDSCPRCFNDFPAVDACSPGCGISCMLESRPFQREICQHPSRPRGGRPSEHDRTGPV